MQPNRFIQFFLWYLIKNKNKFKVTYQDIPTTLLELPKQTKILKIRTFPIYKVTLDDWKPQLKLFENIWSTFILQVENIRYFYVLFVCRKDYNKIFNLLKICLYYELIRINSFFLVSKYYFYTYYWFLQQNTIIW